MSQTSALESQPDSWVMAQQPEESTSLFFLKLKSSAWTLRTLTCTVSEGHLASESQQWLWEFRWTTVLGRMGQEICAVAINPQSSETSETGLCLDHYPCSLWIGIYMRGRMGFPDGSDGKESACNVGASVSVPGSGRSPGEGNGYPLQNSCLENPMDRCACLAIVHEEEQGSVPWCFPYPWTWLHCLEHTGWQ